MQFTWIAIVVLKNLQAHGTVRYVKKHQPLGILELLPSTFGNSLSLSLNVGYVAVPLVLLGNLLVVSGSMLSVQR